MARVAAIQAAKRTADLIPLCHPLALSSITVEIEEIDVGARLVVTVATTDRTGVEMEALTGASVGALTIYDMVKGIERGAEIGPVRLLRHAESRRAEGWSNLYPVGEGAGYAGGIMSAAIDGARSALALAQNGC